MIRKRGTKFVVLSKTGKALGSYDSKAEAEKRLQQIEVFKHMEVALKSKKGK